MLELIQKNLLDLKLISSGIARHFADLRLADLIFFVIFEIKTSASLQIHTFLLKNVAYNALNQICTS
jgi:hypothetical protein